MKEKKGIEAKAEPLTAGASEYRAETGAALWKLMAGTSVFGQEAHLDEA